MQVFPAGTTNTTVDPALLTDLPPALCKKGGATFRIKCLDDGYVLWWLWVRRQRAHV